MTLAQRHDEPIGEMAGYLLVRHHSAVELVDRAVLEALWDGLDMSL